MWPYAVQITRSISSVLFSTHLYLLHTWTLRFWLNWQGSLLFVEAYTCCIDFGFIQWVLGLYSLSGETSCCHISWSLKAPKLDNDRIALKFDRHLGTAAVELPVKFQNDWKMLSPNLAASKLTRSCIKTPVRSLNRGRDVWYLSYLSVCERFNEWATGVLFVAYLILLLCVRRCFRQCWAYIYIYIYIYIYVLLNNMGTAGICVYITKIADMYIQEYMVKYSHEIDLPITDDIPSTPCYILSSILVAFCWCCLCMIHQNALRHFLCFVSDSCRSYV